jgi:hypothetical protein
MHVHCTGTTIFLDKKRTQTYEFRGLHIRHKHIDRVFVLEPGRTRTHELFFFDNKQLYKLAATHCSDHYIVQVYVM